MNNRLENSLTSFSGTGSFWLKNMEHNKEVPFIRTLTRLSLGSSFQSQFEEAVDWMAGTKEVLVENILWTFQEANVIALNAELNQRLRTSAADTDGKVYTAIARPATPNFTNWTPVFLEQNPEELKSLMTEVGDFLLWPIDFEVSDSEVIALEDRKIYYILPIERGFVPVAIASETRELVLGLNYEARDGFLIFFEPPLELFPQRNFVVRSAWKTLKHPHDYVWGVDGI